MGCTITDRVGYLNAAGSFVGRPNLQVLAVPDASYYTFDLGGTWRPTVGTNPNIVGSSALLHGVVTTTDSNGEFTFVLPDVTETHPGSPEPKWSLLFPDGQILTGIVPAVAGPLSVDDLRQTYAWAFAGQIYVAPVVPGQLAKGVASFTGASATVSVLFSSAFSSAPTDIKLSSSLDTNTSLPMLVSYTNVTATGFDIVAGDAAYVGIVSWSAAL